MRALIFWEWHWWQTFALMRDGVTGEQEIDGGWFPPTDLKYPVRPAWMTQPGAIHDWEKKAGKEYFSQFEQKFYRSSVVSAERHLWEALKRARTARQARRICSQSFWRSRMSMLYERAEEFVSALKEDPRYPRKASTKDDRRLLYCAQVMAGISCRIPPATAVDKLRKLKHGKVRSCQCVECVNIKADLVQWILASLSDARVVFLPEMLATLDKDCQCTHCSVMISIGRKQGKMMDLE
jgi:hypothetical protein